MLDRNPINMIEGDSLQLTWSPTADDIALLKTTHPNFCILIEVVKVGNRGVVLRADAMGLWNGENRFRVSSDQRPPISLWEAIKCLIRP